MSKNLVDNTIRCMCVPCWIRLHARKHSPRTRKHANTYIHTHTHTHIQKYVILLSFPLQQWFRERAPMSRYTYIVCIVTQQLQLSPELFLYRIQEIQETSRESSLHQDGVADIVFLGQDATPSGNGFPAFWSKFVSSSSRSHRSLIKVRSLETSAKFASQQCATFQKTWIFCINVAPVTFTGYKTHQLSNEM